VITIAHSAATVDHDDRYPGVVDHPGLLGGSIPWGNDGTVQRVASQLGYGEKPVRAWVSQADIDNGEKPGTSSAGAEKIRRLEQENKELERANEILRGCPDRRGF